MRSHFAFPRHLASRLVALAVRHARPDRRRRGRRHAAPAGAAISGHDDTVYAFGTASFHGSTSGRHLNAPIVGMASTPNGKGYWLVANDGGVFGFNAPFFGSLGAMHLNSPIVGMAATPTGKGYWLVAGDGGVFTFGDAHFYGSTGSMHLNSPINADDRRAGRQGLLADGDRRRRVHVRLGAVPRLDGREAPQRADRRHGRDARRRRLPARRRATAACSRSATRSSTARPATST